MATGGLIMPLPARVAAGTGEQVGVVQALAVQGVDQSLEHMGLANHLAEAARAPFTCKNLITHEKPSRLGKRKWLILAEHRANCIRRGQHPSSEWTCRGATYQILFLYTVF